MQPREKPTLDMTPAGEFVAPKQRAGALPIHLPWQMRVFLAAIALSFVIGLIASLAILLYVVVLCLPLAAAALLLSRRSDDGREPRD